jgi:hypothetical protein
MDLFTNNRPVRFYYILINIEKQKKRDFRLSLYPHSHLFDPEDFEQPYSEEPELTSRDFIYQSWSDSMDSSIDNAMQTESQDTEPVEFNSDEFFNSVINPTTASPDHEVIFSNEEPFFSL